MVYLTAQGQISIDVYKNKIKFKSTSIGSIKLSIYQNILIYNKTDANMM